MEAQANRHLGADATFAESDVLTGQLEEAYRRKIQKHAPILSYYIHTGWTIEILPSVVGIRGLANTGIAGFVDTKHRHAALAFLDIPRQQWKDMIGDSVLESLRTCIKYNTQVLVASLLWT